MFRKRNGFRRIFNTIKSDEGFSVKILGRVGLEYTEGAKKVFIDSEILASASPYFLILLESSIQTWKPPFDNEIIDESKRKLIIENVRCAFRSQGLDIVIS